MYNPFQAINYLVSSFNNKTTQTPSSLNYLLIDVLLFDLNSSEPWAPESSTLLVFVCKDCVCCCLCSHGIRELWHSLVWKGH